MERDSVLRTARGSVKMPLDRFQAAFFEPLLNEIKLVRETAFGRFVEESSVSDFADDLIRGGPREPRFQIRGRISRQLKSIIRSAGPRIGRRITYAAQPGATHRVLIYVYHGRLLFERSRENARGEIETFPVYDSAGWMTTPLAFVDVKPPLAYLAGCYKELDAYREAVELYAQRLAGSWWNRFASSFGKDMASYPCSGWAASVIRELSPSSKRRERVWKHETKPTYPRASVMPDQTPQSDMPLFGSCRVKNGVRKD